MAEAVVRPPADSALPIPPHAEMIHRNSDEYHPRSTISGRGRRSATHTVLRPASEKIMARPSDPPNVLGDPGPGAGQEENVPAPHSVRAATPPNLRWHSADGC